MALALAVLLAKRAALGCSSPHVLNIVAFPRVHRELDEGKGHFIIRSITPIILTCIPHNIL